MQFDDVADTALWIAGARAHESARADALFVDPFAARLAGDKGLRMAETISGAAQYDWMAAVRTVVIDDLVREAIARGTRTVLNLGAGLDTRPYRLPLPPALRWVEVDVDKIVARKEALLAGEAPRCALRRITADLADDAARRAVLADVGAVDHDVLVLTEGVIAYLTEAQVAALADDLRAQPRFRGWIVDQSARLLTRAVRLRAGRHFKNAPLRFAPRDRDAFYRAHGWRTAEVRYLPIEGERLGRPLPVPWWFTPVQAALPRRAREAIRRMFGYARLEPTTG